VLNIERQAEIMDIIRKSHRSKRDKFVKLFYDGNIDNCESFSEGFFALTNLLIDILGENPSDILYAFKQSALCGRKRENY
jgi:hypothetical protein